MELKTKETKTEKVLGFLKKHQGVIFLTIGIVVGYEIGQDVGYYKGRLFMQNQQIRSMRSKM